MDPYAPLLLDNGLKGMIGKGARSDAVVESMKKNSAVYFAATGGAAALISKSITSAEVVAYEDLGAEAIRKLTVEDFPVIVAQDCHGGNIYEEGQKKYAKG
jgi:fumarate hydratase subunit beta